MARWTDDQQKAIETNGKDILVAAAAGSGKTAVLVERVISHVLLPEDDPNHWDVDKLLVVTFTQAAAAEMRQRIELQLQKSIEEERVKKNPDEERIVGLERQIILLSNATISTIHSFCQNIIRQNFTILNDFDPSFRVLMDNENEMLKQDVLDKILESYYEEGNSFIVDFAAKYGDDKRGDEAIGEIVLDLHSKACNQLFPGKWLKDIVEPFNINDDTGIFDTIWGRELAISISDKLRDGIVTYTHLQELVRNDANEKKILGFLGDRIGDLEKVLRKLEEKSWDDMVNTAAGINWGRWVTIKDDKELNEQGKNSHNQVKDSIKKTFEAYEKFTEEMLLEDIREVAVDTQGISQLVQDFMTEYSARKREKNVIDFNDMEHIALKILLDQEAPEGVVKPSSVALEMRDHYQEIMVDEYQDTNEVQDAIIRLVAGDNSGKIFTVGDVKQSIYRFRSAEPALFQNLYKEYNTGANPQNELICLSKNFRSRKEILDGVNYIFGQCMTEAAMDIEYDDRAVLHDGLEYGKPDNGKVLEPIIEIMLVDIPDKKSVAAQFASDDEDEEPVTDMQLEANMIAKRLREIHDSGVMVYDKEYEENNHYRPITWKDMVILSHALKGERSNTLMKSLQDNSIPAYSMKGDGYFDTVEIRIMTALLSVIDNARQDIPLAAVLHSPIVGLTEAELAKLRLNCPEGDFFDVLLAVNSPEKRMGVKLKSRIAKFLQQLSEWRRLSRQVSVSELIWQLYRDTGYYDFVGGLPGGLIRQANLRSLITHAEEFQATDYKGLFRFLQFIKRMRDMENDLEVARTLGESEDVVRIMTIHKSKGLEFPVVVVAGMQKKFNTMDSSGDVIASKKLGLGIKRTDLDTFQRYNTISSMAVSESIRRESIAEELRVLYVAMTRAREKLILTGFVRNVEKSMEKWCGAADSGSGQLSKSTLHRARNFLDWVMPAVVRHPKLADEMGFRGERGHVTMGLNSRWTYSTYLATELKSDMKQEGEITDQLKLISNGETLPVSVEGNIAQRLNWQYDFGGTSDVPGKLSVTELKRRFSVELDDDGAISLSELPQIAGQQEYSFPEPSFVKKQQLGNVTKKFLTGAEYGTLMHNVMQHIDVNGKLTMKGIAQQLDDMATQGIISAEQKPAVNLKQVCGFFKTDIGKRFLAAKQCWRELPFSRMLKAADFYPEVTDDSAEIFIQGVIDVLFQEQDGRYVILDYKTDRDTDEESARERYRLQLFLYSQAVEALLGVKVAERYLYMLRDGKIISV